MLLGEVMVMFSANAAGFNAGAGMVVAGLAGIGVAIGESVKAAGDFQAGLTNLSTAAGENANYLGVVGDSVKKTAVDTGTGTKSLIDALFMIDSSGQTGARGLRTLQVAAQGAKTDNADLMTVSKALTGVMTGWPQTINGAAGSMNELIAASSLGKMHLQDLSKAMGNVIPIATNAGVSFADVGAAVAMMTNKNMTAQRASQNVAFALRDLSAPSGLAQKAMASVGLSAQDLKDTLSTKGLGATLQDITDAIGKTFPKGSIEATTALKNIMGGASGLNVALALGGKNMSTYEAGVKKIADAAKNGGQSVEGWATVQGNFNTKMDQAKAALEVLAINVGTKLLPALSGLLGAVTPLITRFTDWITVGNGIQKFLNDTSPLALLLKAGLIALAGVVGGILVFAFYSLAIAAWAALVPLLPWIAIGALVALAIAGIILAIQHWGQIMTWAGGIMSWLGSHVRAIVDGIGQAVGGAFSAMGSKVREILTGIKNDVGGAFNALGTNIRNAMTTVKNDVGGKFNDLGTTMRNAATGTKNAVGGAFSAIGTTAHNAGQGIVDAGNWMYQHNKYWRQATEDVKAAFEGLKTGLTTTASNIKTNVGNFFDGLGTHLRDFATGTKNFVGGAFDWLGDHLKSSSSSTGNAVGNFFDGMGAHVRGAVTTMKNVAGDAFSALGSLVSSVMGGIRTNVINNIGQAVGGFMSGLGSLLSGAVGKLGELGGDFFSMMGSLASQAVAWGANIIQGIIDGIGSMMSSLGSMVSNAAGVVASALGFGSPTKVGPGKDADKWMPNLINMMSEGLNAGEPTIKSAAIQVASMLSPLINIHSNGTIGNSGTQAQEQGSGGTQTIILQLDGRDLAKALGPHLTQEIRLVTQVRR